MTTETKAQMETQIEVLKGLLENSKDRRRTQGEALIEINHRVERRNTKIRGYKSQVEFLQHLIDDQHDVICRLEAEASLSRSRRDGAITHRDKEIFKLKCQVEGLKKTALDWENQVRKYQGRRPFEYLHPPVGVNYGYTVTCTGHKFVEPQQPSRYTRGGERQKMDGSFIFYLNKDGQHTAEFKSRALRNRVVDDLNEED